MARSPEELRETSRRLVAHSATLRRAADVARNHGRDFREAAQADHARDLANVLSPLDEIARRLRQVADELEAEADVLERQNPL